MARGHVTFAFTGPAGLGGTERYYATGDVDITGLPGLLTGGIALAYERQKLLPAGALLTWIRAGLDGSRKTKLSPGPDPAGVYGPNSASALGTVEPAWSDIICRVETNSGGHSQRFFFGVNDDLIINGLPVNNFHGTETERRYTAYRDYLTGHDWAVRIYDPASVSKPCTAARLGGGADGLFNGSLILTVPGHTLTVGNEVVLRGFRVVPVGWVTGRFIVGGVTGAPTNEIYLRGIMPGAILIQQLGTVTPVAFSVSKISTLEILRIGNHKRGGQSPRPRGRARGRKGA